MEQEVIAAVERAKRSKYKVTSIKVELEANLNRIWGTETCYDFLMERLSNLGLSDGNDPKPPLVFGYVYNDGSVDTEFTFTLLLDDSKNILLLPRVIEIWNTMCKKAGGTVDVRGAGMHMAWLNDKSGHYPSAISQTNLSRFRNFRRSMQLLVPALYFLATHNDTSRGLEWRRPAIECSNVSHGSGKANAIHYKDGALEFRVFDTCYYNPDAILDNVCVMANSLKYWVTPYVNPGLDKITEIVHFGTDNSRRLARFYQTTTQYDLLEAGLNILKPSYRTIEELKAERKFDLKRPDEKFSDAEILADANSRYEEYKDRHEYRQRIGWGTGPLKLRSLFVKQLLAVARDTGNGDYQLRA